MLLNLEVLGYVDGLYHKDVYLPQQVIAKLPDKINKILYTDHARSVAEERKILLPSRVYGGTIFEVEIVKHQIVKACYSIRHFLNTNLCMVFYPYPTAMVCGTVWLNNKCQKITQLKQYKYIQV